MTVALCLGVDRRPRFRRNHAPMRFFLLHLVDCHIAAEVMPKNRSRENAGNDFDFCLATSEFRSSLTIRSVSNLVLCQT